MPLHLVHHPAYDAGFAPDHRFPMSKYTALMVALEANGVLANAREYQPDMPDAQLLEQAHAADYVAGVFAAEIPKPIEKLIGFDVTRKVADRALYATAGTVLAAKLALQHGIACNSAGGSHHARRAHGAGFCTLNDVAVAALALRAEGLAQKILIIDCDVHQGDGTAEILSHTPEIFTLSIHASNNYPTQKQISDFDIGLADQTGDADYLRVLKTSLNTVLRQFTPDFVFYNAGVDVHKDDRLGRLSLTDQGLIMRDEAVFARFVAQDIPICGVIGGGYSKDIEALAVRHAILFQVAARYA